MIEVGIDPGKNGGVCRYDSLSNGLTFYPMPLEEDRSWSPAKMAALVYPWKINGVDRVTIEKVQPFPGNKASDSASSMMAYGMWLQALACYQIPVVLVASITWKKKMGILVPKDFPRVWTKDNPLSDKERALRYEEGKRIAVERAQVAFKRPFVTPRGRLMDGEAEAALIALYGAMEGTKEPADDLPLFGGSLGGS